METRTNPPRKILHSFSSPHTNKRQTYLPLTITSTTTRFHSRFRQSKTAFTRCDRSFQIISKIRRHQSITGSASEVARKIMSLMGFEPKPAPASDINQVSEVAAVLNQRASNFNHSSTWHSAHLAEWLKPDALRFRTAATSETWFMSPAGAGLGSNPIRDYIC